MFRTCSTKCLAAAFLFFLATLLSLYPTDAAAHQPHDPVNMVALSPAFAADNTLLVNLGEKNILLKSVDGGLNFYPPTDTVSQHKIQVAVFSPAYAVDGLIFAGTASGIYYSTDRGESWTNSVAGIIGTPSITALSISPDFQMDGTLFLGTDAGFVYKSVNRGLTWMLLNTVSRRGVVTDIEVSATFKIDHKMFASIWGYGVYKSLDAGLTWMPVNTGLTTLDVTSLALSPEFVTDNTVVASTIGGGVFKSIDGGNTWAAVNSGLPGLDIKDVVVTPNLHLFCISEINGVFQSKDGGASWQEKNNGLSHLSPQTSVHFVDLAVSHAYASDKTLYVATFEGLFYSNSQGNIWLSANVVPQTMDRSLTVSSTYAVDGTVFAGTYGGGVLKSTTHGDTWEVMNQTITNTYIDPMDISSGYTLDQTVLLGTDMGVYKTLDGGTNWSFYPLRPGFTLYARQLELSPDFPVDQTVFASSEFGEGVFRSVDGGETWAQVNNGLPINPGIRAIAVSSDFATDNTVFISVTRHGIYKSSNRGASWVAINAGIKNITAEVISPSPSYSIDKTIFIGTAGNGAFRSKDDGQSWVPMSNGVPYTTINAIALSPNYVYDHTVLAGTSVGGVYKSVDDGATWIGSNTGLLPNIVRDIEFSPNFAVDRTVFVGSNKGVFRSLDAGNTWNSIQHLNRYEEGSDLIFFKQGWNLFHNVKLSGGTLKYNNQPGKFLSFQFNGRLIRWIASFGPNHGMADVFVDGNLIQSVDLYAPKTKVYVPVFEFSGLSAGTHSLRIEVSSSRNPLSRGSIVTIDALDVVQ